MALGRTVTTDDRKKETLHWSYYHHWNDIFSPLFRSDIKQGLSLPSDDYCSSIVNDTDLLVFVDIRQMRRTNE